MENLPSWVLSLSIKSSPPTPADAFNLTAALSVALEALHRATKPCGRYSMDHYQHAKNTIEDSIKDAEGAIKTIEDMGTNPPSLATPPTEETKSVG